MRCLQLGRGPAERHRADPRIEERLLALGDGDAVSLVDVEMARPLGLALDGGAPGGAPRQLIDGGAHRLVERVVDQRDAGAEGVEDPRRREGLARLEHGPRLHEGTPRDARRRLAERHDPVAELPGDGQPARPVRRDEDRRLDRPPRRIALRMQHLHRLPLELDDLAAQQSAQRAQEGLDRLPAERGACRGDGGP